MIAFFKLAGGFSVLLVEVLTGDEDHHLLCRSCGELVETGVGKFGKHCLVSHVVGFPQLHVGTGRSKRSHVDAFFHLLRVKRLLWIIVPNGTAVVEDFL